MRAADALGKYLAISRNDYVRAVRWLNLRLSGLDDAEKRITFLTSVIRDDTHPPELRSEAAGIQGGILRRQGEIESPRQAFSKALQLDDGNSLALTGVLALETPPSPLQLVRTLLARLRNNPRAAHVAWDLASELNSQGLHEESLEMFDHAAELFSPGTKVPPSLVTQRVSAMLDAGRAQQVVETYSSLLEKSPGDSDLHALIVEGWRSLGQDEKSEQVVRSMAARYKILATGDSADRSLQAELAWFYLVTKPDPARAMLYARKAAAATNDPVIQRILGVAELAAGEVDQGIARLKKLVKEDVYAAGFLSEYHFSQGNEELAREAIEHGSALTRGGPAFRKLLSVARTNGVAIPPSKNARQIRQVLSEFERGYLEMGLHPEKFLSVEIRPSRDRIEPGAPPRIEIVLTNKGGLSVPLGRWGLLSPVMSLRVTVGGDEGGSFDNLPLAVWAGPRYLGPGKKLTRTVVLDEDRLVRFLFERPLEDIQLTVTGMLDPVERDEEFRSSIEKVKPTAVTIVRRNLLGEFDRSRPENWVKAYELALGRIVRDLKRGDLQTRLIAGRQVASLLGYLGRVEAGKVEPPEQLASIIRKPVVLSLLRAVLNDESPVVRAEALAALRRVRLTPGILMLLGGSIEDREALVRFRTAELIGLSASRGSRIVLDHLARDGDELVRTMAGLFRTDGDRRGPKRGSQ